VTSFLVIGAGVSGLSLALKLAQNYKVILTSKTLLKEANSPLAQGGIASVTQTSDSFDKHIQDTLSAGAGLCHQPTVVDAIEQAPHRIEELIQWGVNFDTLSLKKFSLTQEGGHSQRRILHVADKTGAHIHEILLENVLKNKNIEIKENYYAMDLIMSIQQLPFEPLNNQCYGAFFYNSESKEIKNILATNTILATGGSGKTFLYTSNWSGATGDGIAMAYRAGARVANLEFTQFHPTCLYHPHARNFLISEAVRGEGGILVNKQGQAFMSDKHPLKDLAPRDIVARAIDREIKQTGEDNVYIDITKKSKDFLQNRFPHIFIKCLGLGIDMSKDPIPVVPAAHYQCGGILTNNKGQSSLPNLYSIGETACNGLHGANRLASNSLLECLTSAHNCYTHFTNSDQKTKSNIPEEHKRQIKYNSKKSSEVIKPDELIVINHMWEEVRRLMWNYVGIVRSTQRLLHAKERIQKIQNEFQKYYSKFETHTHIEELRNITTVAELTIQCALNRKESRGIHFNLDYPDTQDVGKNTII
jgi:L-aspartate oxidase